MLSKIRNLIYKLQFLHVMKPLSIEQKNQIHQENQLTNLKRIQILGIAMVIIEFLLIVFVDILPYPYATAVQKEYLRDYFIMHLTLFLFGILSTFLSHRILLTGKELSPLGNILPHFFMFFTIAFTSVIAGLDQKTTGRIDAYIPILFICSVFILTKFPVSLYLFGSAHLVFLICMLVFQKDPVNLLSNMANGTVVVIMSLILSIFLYQMRIENQVKNILLADANEQLYQLSRFDPLTVLPNRRHFEEQYQSEEAKRKMHGTEIAFLIIDIDHFKNINDRYGHYVGDLVLKKTADILNQNARETDHLSRWGGEEFLMLLINVSENEAQKIAQRIISTIGNTPLTLENYTIPVTVSIGMVPIADHILPPLDSVYIEADKALYEAKNSGRNCLKISSLTTVSSGSSPLY